MKVTLFTDGGARGNPGPAAAGIVLKDEKGNVLKEFGMYLGICTNNEAEYRALVLGLEAARLLDATEVSCFLDSELVVQQLNGNYKVKNQNLRGFYNDVKRVEQGFAKVTYTHVVRAKNKQADLILNQVLDAGGNE